MKAPNRYLLAVPKSLIFSSVFVISLFAGFTAEAAMTLCRWGSPNVIIEEPWYLKNYGFYPIALVAVLTFIIYLIFASRNSSIALRRKWRFIFSAVFVIYSTWIFGVAMITPVVKSYAASLRLFEKAQEGDAVSQRAVAKAYAQGSKTVEKDNGEAYFWYSIASNYSGGNQDAKLRDNAGGYLSQEEIETVNGRIASWRPRKTEKDAEAESWVVDAGGNAGRQMKLGRYYISRQSLAGVPDYHEAAKWFRRAAELGNARSQTALAGMYERGQGVDKDTIEALYLYMISSQSNAEVESIKLIKKMTPEQIVAVHKRLKEDFSGDVRMDKALNRAYKDVKESRLPVDLTVEKLCDVYHEVCAQRAAGQQ